MDITFQYARRRKHVKLQDNPFAYSYEKQGDTYIPVCEEIKNVETYLELYYPEKLQEFIEHRYQRDDSRELWEQLDYGLTWDATPSGLHFWMGVYNSLCIRANRLDLCRT